jgi:hypothetical protein
MDQSEKRSIITPAYCTRSLRERSLRDESHSRWRQDRSKFGPILLFLAGIYTYYQNVLIVDFRQIEEICMNAIRWQWKMSTWSYSCGAKPIWLQRLRYWSLGFIWLKPPSGQLFGLTVHRALTLRCRLIVSLCGSKHKLTRGLKPECYHTFIMISVNIC